MIKPVSEDSEIQKLVRKLLKKELSVFDCAFLMHNAMSADERLSARLSLKAYCLIRHITFEGITD